MAQIVAWLLAQDPKLWDIAAAGSVFLVTYLWRRFAPAIWAAAVAKNPALPQLWITLLGALISAAPAAGKPLGAFVEQFLVGAFLTTIGAQGIHAMLSDLPVPYTGAKKQVAAAFVKRGTPAGGVSALDRPPDPSSAVTPLDRPPPGPKT